MVTLAMIALIAGIILFVISVQFPSSDKSLRNGSLFIMVAGVIGGCFGTPSRDMPNGMPGAGLIYAILVLVGVYMIAKPFIQKKLGNQSQDENPQSSQKKNAIPIIIIVAILIIFGTIAAVSSSNAPSNKPWKDLGVSEREYMEIYNYYKYGK